MALRQQVWVDQSVQGVLVGRVVLYWFCAILYVGIGSACFQYNQNPEWTLAKHAFVLFDQMWPWLPTVVLVLPLAIYDVVRVSNLFVGPIYHLRKHFGALRQDIACAPLTFREDDYWCDLAAPINDMQAEILRLRTGAIELQQVASQTSSLMASFKATLPDEQLAAAPQPAPKALSDTVVNTVPVHAADAVHGSGFRSQAIQPDASSAPPADFQITVADSTRSSQADHMAETTLAATSNAPPINEADQSKIESIALVTGEVSIAPNPSSSQSAFETTAAPAV